MLQWGMKWYHGRHGGEKINEDYTMVGTREIQHMIYEWKISGDMAVMHKELGRKVHRYWVESS